MSSVGYLVPKFLAGKTQKLYQHIPGDIGETTPGSIHGAVIFSQTQHSLLFSSCAFLITY